jgi:hypothetical protein
MNLSPVRLSFLFVVGLEFKCFFLPESFLVHISSCGRHLAALLRSSRLVIIRDFECTATEDVSIYDLAIEVQLGSPCFSSLYLAYENGRIAVATVRLLFSSPPLPTRNPYPHDHHHTAHRHLHHKTRLFISQSQSPSSDNVNVNVNHTSKHSTRRRLPTQTHQKSTWKAAQHQNQNRARARAPPPQHRNLPHPLPSEPCLSRKT